MDAFQAQHGGLRVTLLLGDRIADIFREPIDLAIRYGEPADSSLVARVQLWPEWRGQPTPLYVVYPHRRHVSPSISALVSFLVQRCRDELGP